MTQSTELTGVQFSEVKNVKVCSYQSYSISYFAFQVGLSDQSSNSLKDNVFLSAVDKNIQNHNEQAISAVENLINNLTVCKSQHPK